MTFDYYDEVSPKKPISIKGMDGFETYIIDENTIDVRPKWISVKDSLPNIEGDLCAIYLSEHFTYKILTATYIGNIEPYFLTTWGRSIYGVTHWMSLPRPPSIP